MTRPPPLELFASERPVRSDYARERSYARRRIITVFVLISAICGILYALMGHSPTNPADIPTIKAEGPYKQKPTDPGGIDIPHQDVRVYDQLENKNDPGVPVEHLLPPPETPKDVPHAAQPQPAAAVTENVMPSAPMAAPTPAPVAAVPVAVVAQAPVPVAVPTPAVTSAVTSAPMAKQTVDILPTAPVKTISTTVTAPSAAPVVSVSSAQQAAKAAVTKAVTMPNDQKASEGQGLSIEQVIASTKAMAPQPPPVATAPVASAPIVDTSASEAASAPSAPPVVAPPPAVASSGGTVIQLASVPDETKARSMMADLQSKYATQLGSATLQLVRADLGGRGTFYRIQSQGLSESDAAHICASLKQKNAGCILVRK